MIRVLALETKGHGFDSWPFHFQLTTLGKLFTHMRLLPSSIIWCRSKGSDAASLPLGITDALRLGR